MLPLRGSGQVYLSCGFSPDGQTFAAGGLGHIVELWDLADPTAFAHQIVTDGISVTFVGYIPDGQLVVARMHGALHLVSTDGEMSTTWVAPSHVRRAALAAQCPRLVTAGDSVAVWEVDAEFRLLRDLSASPGEYFTGAAIAPNGLFFATVRIMLGNLRVLEVWESTGGFYQLLPLHGTHPDKLAWSPDGRLLAGLVDKHLHVWDAITWEVIFESHHESESGRCLSLAFHPSGEQLITGDTRGTVSCWDVNSWRCTASYRWDIGPIYALAFAADGLRAAAAGHGAIILWDFDA